MANKRLPMRKIKEVLRLKYMCGLGQREIARSCRMARSTVGDYLKRAEAAGITWPLPEGQGEKELIERLMAHAPVLAEGSSVMPVGGQWGQVLNNDIITDWSGPWKEI